MAEDKNRKQEEEKKLDEEVKQIDQVYDKKAKALDPTFDEKAKKPKKKASKKAQGKDLDTEHVDSDEEHAKTTEDENFEKPVKAGPKARRAKEESQESEKKTPASGPKTKQAPARPKHERSGKKYQEAYQKVDRSKEYSLEDATKLVKDTSFAKFDASVEVHINLGIDPRQADQMIRGTLVLPNGSGKSQSVAVVADGEDQKKAKDAGADIVGDESILENVEKGQIDFDILVATPSMMPKIAKFARTLGKGLMPNPKSGTVSAQVDKTVKELKSGRIEYRTDKNGILHQVVGKVSFKEKELIENITALVRAVNQSKPSNIKGVYLQKITLTSTIRPGVKVDSKTIEA